MRVMLWDAVSDVQFIFLIKGSGYVTQDTLSFNNSIHYQCRIKLEHGKQNQQLTLENDLVENSDGCYLCAPLKNMARSSKG